MPQGTQEGRIVSAREISMRHVCWAERKVSLISSSSGMKLSLSHLEQHFILLLVDARHAILSSIWPLVMFYKSNKVREMQVPLSI